MESPSPITPFDANVMMVWSPPQVPVPPPAPERRSRATVLCFRCGGRGHSVKECRSFKTSLCRFWQNDGLECLHEAEDGSNTCRFAHGSGELRAKDEVYCVRVIFDDGEMEMLGCGEAGHLYQDCPNHQ